MTTSSRARAAAALLALVAVSCTAGDDDAASTPTPTPPPSTPEASPTDTTSPTPSPAASPSWRMLAPSSVERLEAAAAAVGGKVYMAGGLVPGGVSRAVEIYDPAADRWTRGPDLPLALHHAMGVAYRGEFVVLGGFPERGFSGASRRVFALREDRWVELPPLARGRAAGAAGVIGDRLVVAAGQNGALLDETEVFDGDRWRDAAPIPDVRDHVAYAADGEQLYVVGGRKGSIASIRDRVDAYDPARDRWTELPPLPTARGGFGAAIVGELLVAIGGEGSTADAGDDGVFAEAEALDLARGEWFALPPMPSPRHAMGVAAVGDTIVVAAGGARAGASYSTIVDALTVSSG